MSDFKKHLMLESGILLVIVAILGSGILYFYFSINNNIETIASVQREITLRQQSFNDLAQLRKEARAVAVILPELQSKLPSKDKLFDFSRALGQLAKDRGIRFGFSFGSEVPGGTGEPSFVPFQITTGGDLASIQAFLADVEKVNYVLTITDVDLSSANTRISGRVYYK